jgi:hypothetical protein
MRNAHAKKANRLIKQREVLRDQIELLNRKKKKSAEDEQSLEALRTAYDTLVATYDQIYPPPHAGIMPTKFGNILKASEAYSGTRYGIDAVEFWPRLLHVIPSSYKQTIDEARNELSFLVNMSALSVVFYLLCILAILGSAPSPSSANWSKVFENSLRYMLSGGFGLFLNWFFNRAAIFSVADYGMVLRSSYDLFRLDLLEHFRLRSPKDSVEEFQMWKNLRELFVLGQESIEFRPLKYEKRDQKTKVTSGSTKAS